MLVQNIIIAQTYHNSILLHSLVTQINAAAAHFKLEMITMYSYRMGSLLTFIGKKASENI